MNDNQYELLKSILKSNKIDYLLLASLMPYALTIWNNEILKSNLNTFFDRDDGITLVYKTFNNVIKEFIEYKLDPCLFMVKFSTKIKHNTYNFIRSFKSHGHYILNNVVNNEEISYEPNYIEDYNTKYSLEFIHEFLDSDLDKKIIDLKIKGYMNHEIAEILNIKCKKVENNLYLIRKKLTSNNFKKKLLYE